MSPRAGELERGYSVPPILGADRTPEDRGVPRDQVRLLRSDPWGDAHHRFSDLTELLDPGDLLVVNESGTLPASLPAVGSPGRFRVSVSTRYGPELWLVEPRWDFGRPGPVPLRPGEAFEVAGVPVRYLAPFPGVRRLGFLRSLGDLGAAMRSVGRPIRYGYLAREYPLDTYQTVFARVPGSAEMPSAGRPFTDALVRELRARGVEFAAILLHAGVSSLEVGDIEAGTPPVLPEPFEVPRVTVEAIRRARARGRRVIAVGTTVVRALESAADGCGGLRPARGFTRLYLRPARRTRTVDGLLTGFHEAGSTHLALLSAVAGRETVQRSYRLARGGGYLWHEFGDSQLLLAN